MVSMVTLKACTHKHAEHGIQRHALICVDQRSPTGGPQKNLNIRYLQNLFVNISQKNKTLDTVLCE
jgi:hypothetical protein